MLAIAGPAHSVTRAAAMPAVIFFLPISQVQPGCAGRATAIEVLDKPAGAQGKRAPLPAGAGTPLFDVVDVLAAGADMPGVFAGRQPERLAVFLHALSQRFNSK